MGQEGKAVLNQKDRVGNTPLVTAVLNSLNSYALRSSREFIKFICTEVIKRLVQERSVDVNSANKLGSAPLHIAVQGALVTVKCLLEREDINPDQPGQFGMCNTTLCFS